MGEVHDVSLNDLEVDMPSGINLQSSGSQTATLISEKIYVIGGSDEGIFSESVRIFHKSTGEWVVPIVLGTKHVISKAHSSVLLNKERILVLERDAPTDDSIWFLEVDTPYVKEQRKKLGKEVVAWSKGLRGDSPVPIVISGPSGVGKGTLISKLMKEFPSTFGFSVSHTTRSPRCNEKNGVHYHFTDRSSMEKDIRDGKFLESASVHGNLYGTSIEAVEAVTDAGKRCILDIDVQGVRSVRASSLEAIFIFICPPSFEELEKRLRDRGTETEEQIQKRLRNARAELEQGRSSNLFDHILVNDDLEMCYANLKSILGLDMENGEARQHCTKSIVLPKGHLVLEMDQKVLIHGGTTEQGKPSNILYVLDASSLKGGAPGRTKGLNIYAIDSVEGGMGLNNL
ncbi:hypothetical protein AMTRI_Chr03g139850 [Amborella trichopoda]